MCGIAGIVGEPRHDILARMTHALAHRGPDGSGLHIEGRCGFGHRRLAVIDPTEASRQPMSTVDGRWWLTFNGEIYNHVELRDALAREGCSFRTRGDTEVLLEGLARYGMAFVDRLDGQFALALWDATLERLWLVRDRVGIKPLYYAELADGLAFGSEPKALLEVPGVSRELDPYALDAYLDLLYVPPSTSMVRGIRQLPPGHVLRYDARSKTSERRRYWDAKPRLEHDRGIEAWTSDADQLLREAVVRRLRADVPVGAFLSGGLDSSALVAMASEVHPQLHTFSLGFGADGQSYDERAQARAIAQHLGTTHHELVVDHRVLERIELVVRGFDEPFGSPTALLGHALSGFARQTVTVALSGDGGDEVFGGYPRYAALGWARRIDSLPAAAIRPIAARLGAERSRARSLRRRARAFLGGAGLTEPQRYARWVGYRSPEQRNALLVPALRAQLHGRDASVAEAFLRADVDDPIASAAYADLHGFLPHNVLRGSDRMSMQHGLEVRVPFCDHRLIERMFAVPGSLRWRGHSKRILRRLVARRIPDHLRSRAKLGFNGPMGPWLAIHLAQPSGPMSERLASLRTRGLVRSDVVVRLVDEHQRGRRDHSLRLWSLLVLEEWLRRHPIAAAVGPPPRETGLLVTRDV